MRKDMLLSMQVVVGHKKHINNGMMLLPHWLAGGRAFGSATVSGRVRVSGTGT